MLLGSSSFLQVLGHLAHGRGIGFSLCRCLFLGSLRIRRVIGCNLRRFVSHLWSHVGIVYGLGDRDVLQPLVGNSIGRVSQIVGLSRGTVGLLMHCRGITRVDCIGNGYSPLGLELGKIGVLSRIGGMLLGHVGLGRRLIEGTEGTVLVFGAQHRHTVRCVGKHRTVVVHNGLRDVALGINE